jgi:F1F0 ATPase subunit 2
VAAAAVAGIGLGLFYYGGLWLTVRGLGAWQHPGVVFLTSFVVRTLVVVGALTLMTRVQWWLVLVALAGMLVARVALTRRLGPATGPATRGKAHAD